MIQAQFLDFSTQRVAVDSQGLGSLGPIPFAHVKYALDELFLEFRHRVGKQNSLVNHPLDEGFKLGFHGNAPQSDEYFKIPDECLVVEVFVPFRESD